MVEIVSSVESLTNHLKHLEDIHRNLDKKIEEEYAHYLNNSDLEKMKLEKLTLKREIEDLKIKIEEKQNGNKRPN